MGTFFLCGGRAPHLSALGETLGPTLETLRLHWVTPQPYPVVGAGLVCHHLLHHMRGLSVLDLDLRPFADAAEALVTNVGAGMRLPGLRRVALRFGLVTREGAEALVWMRETLEEMGQLLEWDLSIGNGTQYIQPPCPTARPGHSGQACPPHGGPLPPCAVHPATRASGR